MNSTDKMVVKAYDIINSLIKGTLNVYKNPKLNNDGDDYYSFKLIVNDNYKIIFSVTSNELKFLYNDEKQLSDMCIKHFMRRILYDDYEGKKF